MTNDTAHQRVLVVDDDRGIREGLTDLLSRRGFDVVPAEQGREGLERLRACRPDVVLLDIIMPVMSGLDLLAEKNRDPSLAEIPVVVMTARGDAAAALEMGADAAISKPFDAVDIVRLVDYFAARSGPIESTSSQAQYHHGQM